MRAGVFVVPPPESRITITGAMSMTGFTPYTVTTPWGTTVTVSFHRPPERFHKRRPRRMRGK
jgi:hypothetical protein